MILPNVVLNQTVHLECDDFGIDSLSNTQDKFFFENYPHKVSYKFNSRGFRDEEWPTTIEELENSIWCFGDSFTVGLGCSYEHTWPMVLQKSTGKRVINVSLNGASNNWIARKVSEIYKEITPRNIVVMWSFFHRRELNDASKADEERRIHQRDTSDEQDLDNFKRCVAEIDQYVERSNQILFTIPDAQLCLDLQMSWDNIRGDDWPYRCPRTLADFDRLSSSIRSEINDKLNLYSDFNTKLKKNEMFAKYKAKKNILEVPKMDLSRDAFHFGYTTSCWVANAVVPRLVD